MKLGWVLVLGFTVATQAQSAMRLKGLSEPDDPAQPSPAAVEFTDARYGVSFHVPAGWNLARRDGELSSFRKDVKTAKAGLVVRGVASLNYNPYPPTTFAGATLYYSVLPGASAAACGAMAVGAPLAAREDVVVAGRAMKHGEEHHGQVCTEARDEVFTVMRGAACLRFDTVINTFCHASSGAMELGPAQVDELEKRMRGMVESVKIR